MIQDSPKIYMHEDMIDIEIKTLPKKDVEALVSVAFAWQPDITDTRLRMYGSQLLLQILTTRILGDHPEFELVIVGE